MAAFQRQKQTDKQTDKQTGRQRPRNRVKLALSEGFQLNYIKEVLELSHPEIKDRQMFYDLILFIRRKGRRGKKN